MAVARRVATEYPDEEVSGQSEFRASVSLRLANKGDTEAVRILHPWLFDPRTFLHARSR